MQSPSIARADKSGRWTIVENLWNAPDAKGYHRHLAGRRLQQNQRKTLVSRPKNEHVELL